MVYISFLVQRCCIFALLNNKIFIMKIELTPLELEVLKESLENEKHGILMDFNPSSEKGRAYFSAVKKAEALIDELDAYDEMGKSLVEWFLKKYEAQ